MDGQLLGFSVDVHPGSPNRIVACAPHWKNTKFKNNYFLYGRCHEIGYNSDRKFDFTKLYLPTKPKKNTEIVIKDKATKDKLLFVKAMGEGGFSVQYMKDTGELVAGAPGFLDWRGGVTFIDNSSRPMYKSSWLEEHFPSESYAGYSITSGSFYTDRKTIYTVAGSPKWNNVGKVFIFDKTLDVQGMKEEHQGKQFGSYFGASVCAIDINGDDHDDLLVGAPLFTDIVEEGRVYVYTSEDPSANLVRVLVEGPYLISPNKPGGRFGSAIGNLGDINRDGYNDVAVGAPFLNDMAGAVYIYPGGKHGLRATYVQEIQAKQVDSGLRGFGWSFSRAMDTDNNQYADFAVGAFHSDHVVVLRTRPVARVTAKLSSKHSVLDFKDRSCLHENRRRICTEVTVHFKYTGEQVPNQIDLEFHLRADTAADASIELGRAQFVTQDGKLSPSIHRTLRMAYNRDWSMTYTAIVQASKDKFTDIVFELDFKKAESCSSIQPKECPILDVQCPQILHQAVSFPRECGPDKVCIADLDLVVTSPEKLVIGDASIKLKVIVTNEGEDAYLSMVRFRFQYDVTVSSVDTIGLPQDNLEGATEITCSTSHVEETDDAKAENLLECEVGNPLRKGNNVVFLVTFDVSGLEPIGDSTEFHISASTKSQEPNTTLDNNIIIKTVLLERQALMVLTGISSPEQLHYRQKQAIQKSTEKAKRFDLTHRLVIANSGIGTVRGISINVSIPVRTFSGLSLFRVTSLEIIPADGTRYDIDGRCEGADLADLGSGSLDESDDDTERTDQDTTRTDTARDDQKTVLDCTTSQCASVRCDLYELLPRQAAILSVRGRIMESVFFKLQVNGAVKLQTNAIVTVEQHPLMTEDSFTQSRVVMSTDVYGHVTTESAVAWWIVLICAISGLLLLLVVFIILKKVGFFKRQMHMDLQRLLDDQNSSSEMRSRSPSQEQSLLDEPESPPPSGEISPGACSTDAIVTKLSDDCKPSTSNDQIYITPTFLRPAPKENSSAYYVNNATQGDANNGTRV